VLVVRAIWGKQQENEVDWLFVDRLERHRPGEPQKDSDELSQAGDSCMWQREAPA
jgi:hypothetical protein